MKTDNPATLAAEAHANPAGLTDVKLSVRNHMNTCAESFLAGHAWTLQHLSEQGAGEFDETAVRTKFRGLGLDIFVDGARWQHAQDAAVIGALKAGATLETIRRQELQIGQYEQELERLRAEAIAHLALIDGQAKELAEFKTARVMAGPEDVKEYVHNHEVAHSKLRGGK